MKNMIAYHGKPEIKETYLKRVRDHRAADQLVQNYGYWKDGKGCAVGCTLHSGNHAAYETELGIPQQLARLEDRTFEGLPQAEARLWPERFLEAIPVGADLSSVIDRWLLWILMDPTKGVIQHAKTDAGKACIKKIADAIQQKIAGNNLTVEAWRKLREKAWEQSRIAATAAAYAYAAAYAATAAAAADAAAYAAAADPYATAAYAATAAAAYAASASAADATAAAADAAADAADAAYAAAARKKHYVASANKLLELLQAAPIPATA